MELVTKKRLQLFSGRSNLPWEDAVRLDLYYVDNWSLTYDFMILWKTVFAVIRRHGAY